MDGRLCPHRWPVCVRGMDGSPARNMWELTPQPAILLTGCAPMCRFGVLASRTVLSPSSSAFIVVLVNSQSNFVSRRVSMRHAINRRYIPLLAHPEHSPGRRRLPCPRQTFLVCRRKLSLCQCEPCVSYKSVLPCSGHPSCYAITAPDDLVTWTLLSRRAGLYLV